MLLSIKWKRIKKIISSHWFILALLLLLLGFDIYSRFPYIGISDSGESIVLVFVGILATFVVISNYAQVKEAERKADEHKKEIDDDLNRLHYQLCMKYGFVFEGLFRNDDSIKTVFLFQASDYFLSAFEYCKNEQERNIADKNIKDCLANIRNDRIKGCSIN